MIVPDLNLLLYAYNAHSPEHAMARLWWESVLNGEDLIGIPAEVSLGFVRLATHSRLGPAAVGLSVARSVVESWLELPKTRPLIPDNEHFRRVVRLLEATTSRGSQVTDASMASYAIANGATLYTDDGDFARFPGLRWVNPLAAV